MKCNYNIFFSIFVLGQLWWLVGWSHLCGACFPALLHASCFIIAIRHRWARCHCPSRVSSSARWLVSWELAGGNRHFPAESLCSWPTGSLTCLPIGSQCPEPGTLHSLGLGHADPQLRTPTQRASGLALVLSLCWHLAFSPGGELGPSSVFSSLMDHHPWSSSIQCLTTTVLYIPCFFQLFLVGG